MIKVIILYFILIIFTGCSANINNKIWEDKNKKRDNNNKENILFKTPETFKKEFNKNIKITLDASFDKINFFNKYNSNKILNYSGNLENLSSFKFSKFDNFNIIDTELVYTENGDVILSDGKGTIYKLNNNLELIWKKNYYSKKEKKLSPILRFAVKNNSLIVADNLSNFYLIDHFNGQINWKKKNTTSFNSEIKIYKSYFYLVDYENILKCFSIFNGDLVWQYQSENTLIRSNNKISIVLDDENVIFLNNLGDLNALNLKNGNLKWQTPTRSSSFLENTFDLIYSDLVLDQKTIYFSNNKNEFFSVNSKNGNVNWSQNINSINRVSIIDKLIFVISSEGFLVIIEKNQGNIIRSNNIFRNLKIKNIESNGFIIGKNHLYLSMIDGRIVKINIKDGKLELLKKISRGKISRPYFNKKNIFILSSNKIKKFN